MKRYLLFCLLLLTSLASKAQTPAFHWAKDFQQSTVMSSVVDDSENTYIAGVFKGKIDLDPGGDTLFTTSKGDYDIFISKFDFKGDLVWAKTIGAGTPDYVFQLCLDQSGNLYSTGSFLSSVDFDPGAATATMTAIGGEDIFILKLNNKGDYVWSKSLGSRVGNERGFRIKTDDSGNVITTGEFSAVTDFDPGPGTFNMPAIWIPSAINTFILKLDKVGNFIWAKRLLADSSYGHVITSRIQTDKKGNVFIAGECDGLCDLDPGAAYVRGYTGFLLKLNNAGNFVWGKNCSDTAALPVGLRPLDLKLDNKSNLYLFASASGLIDIDAGPAYLPVACDGSLLIKSDTNGNFVWGRGFGGTPASIFNGSIDVDKLDNIYIGSSFTGTQDFDPGPGTFFMTADMSLTDIYISKLDHSGNFQWAIQFGGPSYDQLGGLALSSKGNIFTTGSFLDSTDFDPGPDIVYSASKKGGGFLHKMSHCQSKSSFSTTACSQYSLGRFTYTKTGKYAPFFTGALGCDSIVDLNLTIIPFSDSVLSKGALLVAVEPAATTYQWVKCPAYTAVAGATGSSFTAAVSGSYAVIMTKGFCSDTSKCISVIGTGLSPIELQETIILAPNPNEGVFSIQINNDLLGATATIYNMLGQKVNSVSLINMVTEQHLQSGVYFVEIIKQDRRVISKLIVN